MAPESRALPVVDAAPVGDVRARDPRPGIAGLSEEELGVWFAARDEPAYRASRVLDAVWRSRDAPRAG